MSRTYHAALPEQWTEINMPDYNLRSELLFIVHAANPQWYLFILRYRNLNAIITVLPEIDTRLKEG